MSTLPTNRKLFVFCLRILIIIIRILFNENSNLSKISLFHHLSIAKDLIFSISWMFNWLLLVLFMTMMSFLFPVLNFILHIRDGSSHRFMKFLVAFLAKRWNFFKFFFQLGQKL